MYVSVRRRTTVPGALICRYRALRPVGTKHLKLYGVCTTEVTHGVYDVVRRLWVGDRACSVLFYQ